MLDYPSTRLPELSKGINNRLRRIASILRWMILNYCSIQTTKNHKKYSGIWTDEGSPLLVNTIQNLQKN